SRSTAATPASATASTRRRPARAASCGSAADPPRCRRTGEGSGGERAAPLPRPRAGKQRPPRPVEAPVKDGDLVVAGASERFHAPQRQDHRGGARCAPRSAFSDPESLDASGRRRETGGRLFRLALPKWLSLWWVPLRSATPGRSGVAGRGADEAALPLRPWPAAARRTAPAAGPVPVRIGRPCPYRRAPPPRPPPRRPLPRRDTSRPPRSGRARRIPPPDPGAPPAHAPAGERPRNPDAGTSRGGPPMPGDLELATLFFVQVAVILAAAH